MPTSSPPLPNPTRLTWADAVTILRSQESIDAMSEAHQRVLTARGVMPVLSNGCRITLPAVLNGLTVAHRVSAAEVAGDYLEVDPDLSLIDIPLSMGVHASTGHQLVLTSHAMLHPPGAERPSKEARRVLLGPPGWLADLTPGEFVALQLCDAVLLIHGNHTSATPTAALLEAVKRTAADIFDHLERQGLIRTVTAAELLVEVAAAAEGVPGRLQPTAPMGEVLHAAGLAHRDGWVAEEAAVLPPPSPSPVEIVGAATLHEDRATRRAALRLARAVTYFAVGVADPFAGQRNAVLAGLQDWVVVELLVEATAGNPGTAMLVDAVLPGASRRLRAPLHYLRAHDALSRGDMMQAQRDLQAAVSTAEDEVCVVTDLANIAALRGDHGHADHLVARLGYDRHWLSPATAPADDLERVENLLVRANAHVAITHSLDLGWRLGRVVETTGRRIGDLPPMLAIDIILFDLCGLDRFACEMAPLLRVQDRELVARVLEASARSWWRVQERCDSVVSLIEQCPDGRTVTASLSIDRGVEPGPSVGDVVVARLVEVGEDVLAWAVTPSALGRLAPDRLPDPEDVPATLEWRCH